MVITHRIGDLETIIIAEKATPHITHRIGDLENTR